MFGALHGLETLYQLIGYNLTDNIYCISDEVIIYYPRFPYQGIMIDTSRRYMSISVITTLLISNIYLTGGGCNDRFSAAALKAARSNASNDFLAMSFSCAAFATLAN